MSAAAEVYSAFVPSTGHMRENASPAERDEASRSDAELLQAVGGGDRAALALLYDRYAPYLLGVARRFVGDSREAEDVVHDVLLEAWHRTAQYDPTRGTVRAWLSTRVRGRSIDRLRSDRRRAGTPREAATTSAPPEDPEVAAERQAARRAVASLSDVQRSAIELAYFEGLSASEIAARCDLPLGTVKSRLAAALASLRRALQDEEAGGAG